MRKTLFKMYCSVALAEICNHDHYFQNSVRLKSFVLLFLQNLKSQTSQYYQLWFCFGKQKAFIPT